VKRSSLKAILDLLFEAVEKDGATLVDVTPNRPSGLNVGSPPSSKHSEKWEPVDKRDFRGDGAQPTQRARPRLPL